MPEFVNQSEEVRCCSDTEEESGSEPPPSRSANVSR